MTLAGVPVGTPSYMAPEQAVGEELGPWTDLYSAGIMAWELFVGHLPFRDTPSAVGLLLRNANEAIPPAHAVEPSVDPEISAWIETPPRQGPARARAVGGGGVGRRSRRSRRGRSARAGAGTRGCASRRGP